MRLCPQQLRGGVGSGDGDGWWTYRSLVVVDNNNEDPIIILTSAANKVLLGLSRCHWDCSRVSRTVLLSVGLCRSHSDCVGVDRTENVTRIV